MYIIMAMNTKSLHTISHSGGIRNFTSLQQVFNIALTTARYAYRKSMEGSLHEGKDILWAVKSPVRGIGASLHLGDHGGFHRELLFILPSDLGCAGGSVPIPHSTCMAVDKETRSAPRG